MSWFGRRGSDEPKPPAQDVDLVRLRARLLLLSDEARGIADRLIDEADTVQGEA